MAFNYILTFPVLYIFITCCLDVTKERPLQRETEWLLGHCTGDVQDTDTICATHEHGPVSCVAMPMVSNCEKAAASFSETAAAELQDLTKESFRVDENKEYLCYLPQTTEGVNPFIGYVMHIEKLEEKILGSPVSTFGCSYPKKLTASEDLEETLCCKRFSQTFLQDETHFSASVHSLPAQLTSYPKSGSFKVRNLRTISLENYKVNFFDNSLPDISFDNRPKVEPPAKNSGDGEKFPILEMTLISGALIICFIVAAAVAIYIYNRNSEIPAGVENGENSPKTEPKPVCRRHSDVPSSVQIFHLGGEAMLAIFNDVNDSAETSLT